MIFCNHQLKHKIQILALEKIKKKPENLFAIIFEKLYEKLKRIWLVLLRYKLWWKAKVVCQFIKLFKEWKLNKAIKLTSFVCCETIPMLLLPPGGQFRMKQQLLNVVNMSRRRLTCGRFKWRILQHSIFCIKWVKSCTNKSSL